MTARDTSAAWVVALAAAGCAGGCPSEASEFRPDGSGGTRIGDTPAPDGGQDVAGGSGGGGGVPQDGPSDGGLAWWDDSATAWTPAAWGSPCGFRFAAEPSLAAPPLIWEPCPGGEPGCSIFTPVPPPGVDMSTLPFAARTPGGWWFGIWYAGGDDPVDTGVFYDTDGKAVVAVRDTHSECWAEMLPGAGPEGCILFRSFTQTLLSCGTPDQIMKAPAATADLGISPQVSVFTGEVVAMWLSAKLDAVYDLDAAKLHILDGPNTAYSKPTAWDAYVFMPTFRPGGVVDGVLWKRPNELATLVAPAPEVLIDINGEGTHLVWIQAQPKAWSDPLHSGATLWRSPFATVASDVVPTKLRDLGDFPAAVLSLAGQGFYTYSKTTHMEVFRLADGRHWTAPMPKGYEIWGEIAGIDSEYLFYGVRPVPGWGSRALVRQRLDALGPGD